MREVKIVDGKLKCSRCGKIKPVEMFSKGHNKSGYKSYCKACASADYFKNRDYNIQKRKEHYQNNKEIYAEYGRKRRTEKADEVSAYMHEYYVEHSDVIRARSALAYKNITEDGLEKRRQSYHKRRATKAFKTRMNAYMVNRKNTAKHFVSDLTESEWMENVELFGGKCAYCGSSDELTRDHVIPLTKGGGYTKSNIVPCCKSCNSKKHNYDMETWYRKQPFFSEENLLKIKWLSDNRKVVNL